MGGWRGWEKIPTELRDRTTSDSPFKKEDITDEYICASENTEVKTKYSKYRNKKTEIDGIVFDSIKEADYYQLLKLRKRNGEIVDFETQVVFTLQDGFEYKGKRYRPITYVADFRVENKDGNMEVLDIKGSKFMLTDVYKLKKKLLLFSYPEINFKEIF